MSDFPSEIYRVASGELEYSQELLDQAREVMPEIATDLVAVAQVHALLSIARSLQDLAQIVDERP
jgi:hypothetical protein